MSRWLEIPALGIIIAICAIHAHRFAANIKIGPWFHIVWGCIYASVMAFMAWQVKSWWLLGGFAIERFVFYNMTLNILRYGWRWDSLFYIHAEKNGSWWDRIELAWKGLYPYIWGVGVLAFVIIQFYIA